jgi:uncharacterized membrane protein
VDARFIVPNYHVILIHYPLALLVAGVIAELATCFWSKSGARVAGRWMILLGALSMLPAATSGMSALADVIEHRGELTEQQYHSLKDHTVWMAIASLIITVSVTIWIGCCDRVRILLRWPVLVLLLWAVLMMGAAAWHAGEAVYKHGVAQIEPTTQTTGGSGLGFLIPPMEGHLLSAGAMLSFVMLAIAVSFRKVNRYRELRRLEAQVKTVAYDLDEPAPKPARYAIVAIILAGATVLFGWWYLSSSTDAWATAVEQAGPRAGAVEKTHTYLSGLLDSAFERGIRTRKLEYPRRALHVVSGVLIVVLLAALAVLARFVRKGRVLLSIVSILLVASLATQVWLGTLLLYYGPAGPVTAIEASQ